MLLSAKAGLFCLETALHVNQHCMKREKSLRFWTLFWESGGTSRVAAGMRRLQAGFSGEK